MAQKLSAFEKMTRATVPAAEKTKAAPTGDKEVIPGLTPEPISVGGVEGAMVVVPYIKHDKEATGGIRRYSRTSGDIPEIVGISIAPGPRIKEVCGAVKVKNIYVPAALCGLLDVAILKAVEKVSKAIFAAVSKKAASK